MIAESSPNLKFGRTMCALAMLLLAGCAWEGDATPGDGRTGAGSSSATESKEMHRDLRSCALELAALKITAPEIHRDLQARFERVMHAASNYSGVRDRVNPDTRATADAFYEYETSVVCSRVRQETLEALTTLPGADHVG